MECEFCEKILSSKSALNTHQRTAKYCLNIQGKNPQDVTNKFKCELCNKIFLNNNRYKYHKNICLPIESYVEDIRKLKLRISELEKENKTTEENLINVKQMNKDLQKENDLLIEYKNELREDYKDLSITAVKRPTKNVNTKNIQINNFIHNTKPLNIKDIKETIQMLTLDHHVKGAEGYAEYALEFPFKDKIVCVDVNRNKIKYKDGEGNVIEDIGFQKMMTKLCESLKDRSFNLCQEHYEKLSEQFTYKELDEYNCMNTALAISRYANGRENEFCTKLIKLISKGSTVTK
jgi:hypothetical protein